MSCRRSLQAMPRRRAGHSISNRRSDHHIARRTSPIIAVHHFRLSKDTSAGPDSDTGGSDPFTSSPNQSLGFDGCAVSPRRRPTRRLIVSLSHYPLSLLLTKPKTRQADGVCNVAAAVSFRVVLWKHHADTLLPFELGYALGPKFGVD